MKSSFSLPVIHSCSTSDPVSGSGRTCSGAFLRHRTGRQPRKNPFLQHSQHRFPGKGTIYHCNTIGLLLRKALKSGSNIPVKSQRFRHHTVITASVPGTLHPRLFRKIQNKCNIRLNILSRQLIQLNNRLIRKRPTGALVGPGAVGETVAEELRPIRAEYDRLMADKAYLESCYRDGAQKARTISQRTLDKVYKKIGFLPASL